MNRKKDSWGEGISSWREIDVIAFQNVHSTQCEKHVGVLERKKDSTIVNVFEIN